MLKSTEIRDLGIEEMEEKVETLKKDLFTLRLELQMGKLERHSRLRQTKRDIARLMTILREEKNSQQAPKGKEEKTS